MHAKRFLIGEELLVEFLPPKGRAKKKAVILLPGMPSSPCKSHVLKFFSGKGFPCFLLRYRGTWESKGEFLKESPKKDVLDLISACKNPMKEAWAGEDFELSFDNFIVVGSSFGGSVALECADILEVSKIISMSPVVDWSTEGEEEPLDLLENQVNTAFGGAFRFRSENWKKFISGKIFNPVNSFKKENAGKVFIAYSTDDKVIDIHSVEKFVENFGTCTKIYKKCGHLSLSHIKSFFFWRRVKKFLKK